MRQNRSPDVPAPREPEACAVAAFLHFGLSEIYLYENSGFRFSRNALIASAESSVLNKMA